MKALEADMGGCLKIFLGLLAVGLLAPLVKFLAPVLVILVALATAGLLLVIMIETLCAVLYIRSPVAAAKPDRKGTGTRLEGVEADIQALESLPPVAANGWLTIPFLHVVGAVAWSLVFVHLPVSVWRAAAPPGPTLARWQMLPFATAFALLALSGGLRKVHHIRHSAPKRLQELRRQRAAAILERDRRVAQQVAVEREAQLARRLAQAEREAAAAVQRDREARERAEWQREQRERTKREREEREREREREERKRWERDRPERERAEREQLEREQVERERSEWLLLRAEREERSREYAAVSDTRWGLCGACGQWHGVGQCIRAD